MKTALRALRRVWNRELNWLSYNMQGLKAWGQPRVYQIELTNHCPMVCNTCPRTEDMTRPLGHMEARLFRKIIDETRWYTGKVILHHMGESLVHPEIGDLIRYATDRGLKTHLSVNPVLLNEGKIRALVDNGLSWLVLSLDGVTSETSRRIRGPAAANVDLAEKNVMNLIRHKRNRRSKTPLLEMQIVKSKQNLHEIDAYVRKWTVDGIDRVTVKSYVTWGGQDERINALKAEPTDVAVIRRVTCVRPWESLMVLWDGRVVPCCFDYDGAFVIGDLNHETIREIWNNARMRFLRTCHRDKALSYVRLCEKCTDKEGFPPRKWYYPLNRWLAYEKRAWNVEN